MLKKGRLKVMVGRTGTKIQEEFADHINVYSLEQWKKELAKREAEAKKGVEEPKESLKSESKYSDDGDFEGENDLVSLKN